MNRSSLVVEFSGLTRIEPPGQLDSVTFRIGQPSSQGGGRDKWCFPVLGSGGYVKLNCPVSCKVALPTQSWTDKWSI